jgi:hypothetical protein
VRGFGWTSRESGGGKLCAFELCHPDESEAIRRSVDGFSAAPEREEALLAICRAGRMEKKRKGH